MTSIRSILVACVCAGSTVACVAPVVQPTAVAPAGTASVLGSGSFKAVSGEAVRAVYASNGTVTLTFADGSSKVLTQAVSGSGIRYVAGPYEWLEHQGEARYLLNDKPVFVGRATR